MNYEFNFFNKISLLNYFRQGDKNHFMEVWWKVLSELKKEMGIEAESGLAEDTKTDTKTETNNTTTATMIAQNLEFNIQVYFAIYPIHDYVDRSQSKMLDINTTMMEFKKYLEKNSTKLSQSPQYIPFYALPYISDPKHHTLFRETFTEQWILNLENQLKLFMESYLKSTKKPKLYSLLQNENDYVHEIENYKNQILALKSNEETLDQKYNNLKNDYGHLVSLSSELVKVLSDSIQGEKISETFLYDISRQISMFEQKNVEEYRNLKSISPLSQNIIGNANNELSQTKALTPAQINSSYNNKETLNPSSSNSNSTLINLNSSCILTHDPNHNFNNQPPPSLPLLNQEFQSLSLYPNPNDGGNNKFNKTSFQH
ncbi:hypothetical protein LY90DRAFT_510723 [Neocallimastix californiae]|uniref:ARMC9 CTLH-like domain-containing protein n=1 Tax=Neocallimastix californiae TaxID=1754190 RepID=A0A1Y2BWV1_9FUNG|nr:hypothetical protein LY90DRAFT_510723 [Neocallimastix californiae]|eukprot:ORY39226.1 hypothetical protein LY90DRAFT_510723 [Neocallimastix californiae]